MAGELIEDIRNVLEGTLTQTDFMARYGHLRPGTYDILSLRYDQRTRFFDGLRKRAASKAAITEFKLSAKEMTAIASLLKEAAFSFSAETLINYIKNAIAGREYAKFVFTKNVSDALELIAEWGERVGLNREELSYLKIEEILDAQVITKGRSLEHHLRRRADVGASEHELSRAIHLPQLIEIPEDVSVVPLLFSRPNFITSGSVQAPSVFLDGRGTFVGSLSGKIILIESADPGFDWIFSHQIAGLVTKFGGANSHMAIRCAEFGIPAAIGSGEQIFNRLLESSGYIEIDCASERVVPTEVS